MRFYEIVTSDGLSNPSLVSKEEIRDILTNRKSSNFDLQDRIRYFYKDYVYEEFYFAIRNKRKIVAMAGLQNNPHDKIKNNIWVKFISVDPKYQNRGLSKKLLRSIFEWAQENHKSLTLSSYTEKGEKFIKPEVDRLKNIFPNVTVEEE